jgi:hypothetical protein
MGLLVNITKHTMSHGKNPPLVTSTPLVSEPESLSYSAGHSESNTASLLEHLLDVHINTKSIRASTSTSEELLRLLSSLLCEPINRASLSSSPRPFHCMGYIEMRHQSARPPRIPAHFSP